MSILGVGINADSKRINGRIDRFQIELETFEKLGFDYVEISPHAVDAILHGRLNPHKIDYILDIAKSFNLKYTVHAPDVVNLKDVEHYNMQLNVLRSSIDFASLLHAKIVVYHLGTFIEGKGLYYEQRQKEIDGLKNAADYAKDLGVVIGVENISHSSREVVDTIRNVNRDNVGMTLDFGHLFLWANRYNKDYMKEVETGLEYAVHMHIHDNFGESTALYEYHFEHIEIYTLSLGLGDLHMPIGWGQIPYGRIFELVRKSDYNGVLINEINSWERYFNAVKSLPDVTRKSYNGKFNLNDKSGNGFYFKENGVSE